MRRKEIIRTVLVLVPQVLTCYSTVLLSKKLTPRLTEP